MRGVKFIAQKFALEFTHEDKYTGCINYAKPTHFSDAIGMENNQQC